MWSIGHITSVHAAAVNGNQMAAIVIFKVNESVFGAGEVPKDNFIHVSDSGLINTKFIFRLA